MGLVRGWIVQLVILWAAAPMSLQSCPTLCDPIDGSPPGCPIPGILQARTLEWVTISFFNILWAGVVYFLSLPAENYCHREPS